MARIAVVAGPDPGHALPAIGLGAALDAAGHVVHVYSGTNHRALAGQLGLPLSSLPLLGPTPGDDDLGYRIWRRAGEMSVPLAATLRGFAPDLVVVDTLTRCGAFAAQQLGCPWVELVAHHLDDPDDELPPVGLGRAPARTPWRRLDDRRLVGYQRRSIAVGAAQAAAVARDLGLDAVEPPVIRLIATLPALEGRRRSWPQDAHVVGPLATEPPLPPLEPPEAPGPLVVVTDSTATGVERGIGARAIQALARTDLRVVVTSSRLAPRRTPRLVVGRGPHEPLLAEAAVAVSPGGGGFLSKACAAGVPQVVIPLMGDQLEAAARLVDVGVGRTLPPGRATPRRLRWAIVRQSIDRDAQRAARHLADQAARLGPPIAVALLERVLAGDRPVARSPAEHLRSVPTPPTASAPTRPDR